MKAARKPHKHRLVCTVAWEPVCSLVWALACILVLEHSGIFGGVAWCKLDGAPGCKPKKRKEYTSLVESIGTQSCLSCEFGLQFSKVNKMNISLIGKPLIGCAKWFQKYTTIGIINQSCVKYNYEGEIVLQASARSYSKSTPQAQIL